MARQRDWSKKKKKNVIAEQLARRGAARHGAERSGRERKADTCATRTRKARIITLSRESICRVVLIAKSRLETLDELKRYLIIHTRGLDLHDEAAPVARSINSRLTKPFLPRFLEQYFMRWKIKERKGETWWEK